MLNSKTDSGQEGDLMQELKIMGEEAHYKNTIDDFVELIVVYGYKQVVTDLAEKMEAKEW